MRIIEGNPPWSLPTLHCLSESEVETMAVTTDNDYNDYNEYLDLENEVHYSVPASVFEEVRNVKMLEFWKFTC